MAMPWLRAMSEQPKPRPATPTSTTPSPSAPNALQDTQAFGAVQQSSRVEDIVRRDLDVRLHAAADALFDLASRVAHGTTDANARPVGDMVYVINADAVIR